MNFLPVSVIVEDVKLIPEGLVQPSKKTQPSVLLACSEIYLALYNNVFYVKVLSLDLLSTITYSKNCVMNFYHVMKAEALWNPRIIQNKNKI